MPCGLAKLHPFWNAEGREANQPGAGFSLGMLSEYVCSIIIEKHTDNVLQDWCIISSGSPFPNSQLGAKVGVVVCQSVILKHMRPPSNCSSCEGVVIAHHPHPQR